MTTDVNYLGHVSPGPTDYSDRMREIQLAFIDDPRKAALDADGLVSELLQSFTDELAQRRKELTAKQGDDAAPDTEQLRQSVRRYRELLDTLTRTASPQAVGSAAVGSTAVESTAVGSAAVESAQAQALERPEETTYRVGENGEEPEAIDRDAIDHDAIDYPANVSWPSENTEILERR